MGGRHAWLITASPALVGTSITPLTMTSFWASVRLRSQRHTLAHVRSAATGEGAIRGGTARSTRIRAPSPLPLSPHCSSTLSLTVTLLKLLSHSPHWTSALSVSLTLTARSSFLEHVTHTMFITPI